LVQTKETGDDFVIVQHPTPKFLAPSIGLGDGFIEGMVGVIEP
jgi:hypothetical protein